MKPIKLEMKDFMSYEKAEIDFSAFSLGVIVGHNGAGKSTILQAITYALWGQVRSGINNIVRRGTTSCSVRLTFSIGENIYTVTRRRDLSGRGSSELEFVHGDLILTRGTIKETQEEIYKVLPVGYDVFASSSLLGQGDSSRFSSATPATRKEILGEIIGIADLQKIELSARNRRKALSNDIATTTASIQAAEKHLADIGEPVDIDKINWQITELSRDIDLFDELIDGISGLGSVIDGLKEKIEFVKNSMEDHNKHLDVLQKIKKELDDKVMVYNVYINDSYGITMAAREFSRLSDALPYLEELREKYRQIEERDKFVLELSDLLNERDEITAELNELDASIELLREELTEFKTHIAKLESELSFVKNTRDLIAYGVTCPTCGQLMDNRPALIAGLDNRIGKIEKGIESSNITVSDVSITLLEEEKRRAYLVDKINGIMVKAAVVGEKIRLITLQIGTTKYSDIDYTDEYEWCVEQLKKLDGAKEELATLEEARNNMPDLRNKLYDIEAQIEGTNVKIEECTVLLDKLRKEIEEHEFELEQYADLDSLKMELDSARDSKNSLILAAATAEANKLMRIRLNSTLKELKETLGKQQELLSTLDILVAASSKTGAQALIIESVLPELESTANEYLSSMSPGMEIRFESQKITTSGNVSETLGIFISIDGQDAPIETLSGGERYRADLSLRLAIGSLLANRSGAKIEMLAIDEGFGTQDEDGIVSVTNTILGLTTIFPLILVVTHVMPIAENIGEYGSMINVTNIGGKSQVRVL